MTRTCEGEQLARMGGVILAAPRPSAPSGGLQAPDDDREAGAPSSMEQGRSPAPHERDSMKKPRADSAWAD